MRLPLCTVAAMGQLTFPPVTVGDMMPLEVPYALEAKPWPCSASTWNSARTIDVDAPNREAYLELACAG